MRKVKVGVIGCGVISDIYLTNSKKYNVLEVIAVCDVMKEKADAQARKYNIPKVYYNVDNMLEDKEIEVVLNITVPQAHYEISKKALLAGKHVFSEKSLAITIEEGKELVALADKKGLRIGCAPDTFLGGRLQTFRKLIDDGWIGKPIAATAFMACHGHECWHPGPQFYYKTGAGPMFDMGPYYVTALLSLLGPATRVSGEVQKTFEQRRITSQPCFGELIDVEIPTHIAGTINFACGAIGTIITSFDVWDSHLPRFEIYGTEGTLSMAEADPLAGPNDFEGQILFRRYNESDWNGFPTQIPRSNGTEWRSISSLFGYNENSRALGLADMCAAIQTGRKHRAHGTMALHSLEIMQGIHLAAAEGKYHNMETTCDRPEPLQMSTPEYAFEK
ncbi:Gfo/Idh/MocA family oxidoreductase [uncultured Sphaerochaeta sp.]|uniref:Gfo/Idh/MocA family protein n=1 Tax=uncultured Sphaerochaeta sp. TaxID=886478 RepID=UPI002A0AA00A|nr:Gfo/Idh/MocA family oxidoreductase [uncultured Sphaerochaeta sp.]